MELKSIANKGLHALGVIASVAVVVGLFAILIVYP